MPLLIAKRKVRKLIDERRFFQTLTDEQLTKMLNDEGIMVTRRTVAKYREDLKIPSTHQRRVKIKNSELSNPNRQPKTSSKRIGLIRKSLEALEKPVELQCCCEEFNSPAEVL